MIERPTILCGDVLAMLRTLPASSVHCCVTSPPYYGLRDYGHEGQIGLEPTPEAYVAKMVEVFREVRRVLRDDGTLWLNLGDSYSNGGRKTRDPGQSKSHPAFTGEGNAVTNWRPDDGAKPKDLLGIPWRVAFALQADGWWLRQDIIWHKPNPMPESVTDRCTKAHEYVFLLAKSERYYYDAEAVAEPSVDPIGSEKRYESAFGGEKSRAPVGDSGVDTRTRPQGMRVFNATRNRRSVWTITTKPYSGAHFAVMPPDLVEPCILAGCPVGGTVLDPFAGSGTTLAVAARHGRRGIGVELNPDYVALAERRIQDELDNAALFVS